MLGSLRVGRWGATSKIGFDHVGEDDARLGDIEGSDGRVHLVETLAAAQKFGIDRADLVEHLAQFAEVGEELADFGVGRIRHVTDPRALAGSTDCGKISLGAIAQFRRHSGSWAARSVCRSRSASRAVSVRSEAGGAQAGGDACEELRMTNLECSSDGTR